jgi:hypothetical protein
MNGKMKLGRMRLPAFFGGLLSVTMGFLLLLPLISDKALAKRPPTWQLVDNAQKGCVNISSPYSDRTTYYAIWIEGSWTHSLNAGVRNAPDGSTSWGSYLPIRPGSSDGIYSLAYVAVQVAPDTPVDNYIVNLWVDDGTRRQAVPVTLVVADSCSDY